MALPIKTLNTGHQFRAGKHVDDAIGLLSSRDAAAWLDVSERTLWTIASEGDLPRLRVRGSVKYDIADLRAYVAKLKA